MKPNESFDWLERRHDAYAVFAPRGHDKRNAAFHRRPEIEVTLFPFDDFYPKIHWIVEDALLRLVR
jgi:hypothetical protein